VAKAFEVNIVGVNKLLSDINKYSTDIQNRIAAELEDAARNVQDKAAQDAQNKVVPLSYGAVDSRGNDTKYNVKNFSGMITFNPISKFKYEIIAGHPMSAYFEFGTGTTVFDGETWVDEELRQYAFQFYVNGRGTIMPAPFLFNNFYEERIKLINELKRITGSA
jgi:hypothetical protein